uniref:NET domain-containing protein n=1 Tax=viral metagenome TaxID=1070528 RepID=A0A6C0C190_9ZZZZ
MEGLKESIEKLDKLYHIEVLKIFLKHNINVNENKNGIFINLTTINNDVLFSEINDYLKNFHMQEKHFQKNEDIKKHLETAYFC